MITVRCERTVQRRDTTRGTVMVEDVDFTIWGEDGEFSGYDRPVADLSIKGLIPATNPYKVGEVYELKLIPKSK